MTIHIRKHGIFLALALALLGASAAQATERSPERYVMIVYSDLPHGKTILHGAPDEVITALSTRLERGTGGIADRISLCVAYAKMKQIDLATRHCDAALAASARATDRRTTSAVRGRHEARTAVTDRAIALVNRGVLHALVGESEQATELFELATTVDATKEHAQTNLAHLATTDESEA